MGYIRDGRCIKFSYGCTQLMRSFLEFGNDIVPIGTNQDGSADLDGRSKAFPFVDDPDEVSSEMIVGLFSKSYSRIALVLSDLLMRSASDDGNIMSGSEGAELSISIHDDNLYNEHDIESLDSYIGMTLPYGALNNWFIQTSSGLSEVTSAVMDSSERSIIPTVDKMTRILKRKTLRNPFTISTEILSEC